jgi:16S rRNA (cytosine1402-N4)-methyltransferase
MHKSVLLQESIDGLDIQAGDTVLDATLGGGGHSMEIRDRFGDSIFLIGIDAEEAAITRSRERIETDQAIFIQENFRNLDKVITRLGVPSIDRMIFDIGLSSFQFQSGRGFSFQGNDPLLMTFKDNPSKDELTAIEIVNEWDEENLVAIIENYGEERFAKRISRAIVEARKENPIRTTHDLVEVIQSAVPRNYERGRIHPATRTFQALRITVNDELGALREGILKGFDLLSHGGRMSVISFHSLEDRIVKHFFRKFADQGLGTLITKKPIIPTPEEIEENPRSRSAKLRIIEKV